ncbi:hypothetical protein [Streptomyces sp. NPDC026673]|uniref:hypothetical protein n=1 Tax=Streptomyces sp. NPDC026673 TaxID=3155724 RepID=UPI0033C7A86F
MPSLRTLLTLPRVLRHGTAVGAGLPPDEAVVLDVPDVALRTALAAAGTGDHAPARELLSATRLGCQWEQRDVYVSELAQFALHNPGWLDAWLAAAPEDPDAALVRADLRIHQAWEIRSGARAAEVSPEQFKAFFALLKDAVPVIGAAAELNPADPVPWRIALTHARGMQSSREIFDAYWTEAVERAPHHYGCHASALQYLCAKWYGTHREMFDFAEQAAEEALPGSKINALPLLAAVEYEIVAGGPAADDPSGADSIPPHRVAAAVDRALELSGWYDPGDPEAAGFRNHLVLMLVRAGRWEEALRVFRAIGVHATSFPWAHLGGDPRRHFLDVRTGVRVQVATRTPFFGAPPAVPVPAGAPDWAPRSLAVASAPLTAVAQAALLCRTGLRLAPAGAAFTHVELTGEGSLAGAVDLFTTGEKWPAVVLQRSGDRYGITLYAKGRKLAGHEWAPGAPVPSLETAGATAAALAAAYGVADARPLTALLRAMDAPGRRLADTVAALGLPALPEGFGERSATLDGVPGARVLAPRGFLSGVRDTLTTEDGAMPLPPRGTPVRFPARWWAMRALYLLLLAPAACFSWWGAFHDRLRPVPLALTTLGSGYVLTQVVAALRRRG